MQRVICDFDQVSRWETDNMEHLMVTEKVEKRDLEAETSLATERNRWRRVLEN